jgi:hypothetical protein
MKRYKVTRQITKYLSKTVEVPDDMDIDDVCEQAWVSPGDWEPDGSRDVNVECEQL